MANFLTIEPRPPQLSPNAKDMATHLFERQGIIPATSSEFTSFRKRDDPINYQLDKLGVHQ